MRRMVQRSLVLIFVVLSLSIPAAPVSAGPPIDLPRLDIAYDYAPPLDSHGYWVGDPRGGQWRVTGSRLDRAGRLTLDLEVRPPAISVPLEPGPAVLFGTLSLGGDAGGDMYAGASVPRLIARVLPACPDPADCVYRGSVTLPTHLLPGLAVRKRAESWSDAVIGLTLVRTFAQGTWLQVLPLEDSGRDEPYGTVGHPRRASIRMLALGASPVGPHELWSRRDRSVLDRIERLRRSIEDPSRLPETQPLLVDIETAPCTPGWTIATATGDVLVDVREPGPSVPVRVEVPVGAEWSVSVPSIGRAQGTGDRPRTFGPFRSDVPGLVTGWISGDPYLCEGVEPGSVAWRPATAEEVASFPEPDPGDVLATYATLPARDSISPASSPFERLWQPVDAADIPFHYTCAEEVTFTTTDLATASPTADVPDSLAAMIEEVGPQISDDGADWHVVRQSDDRVLALAPMGSSVDEQHLSITDEGWRFRTGGGPCQPRAVVGETSTGRWRLDPGFPAPGPETRTLHVLGYLACNGTERAGKPLIQMTDDAALIAIPMRTTRTGGAGACFGPTRMTVTLPEPLGQRTLYDASSLPLRGANEKLDIDRVNSSGSGG